MKKAPGEQPDTSIIKTKKNLTIRGESKKGIPKKKKKLLKGKNHRRHTL